MDAYTPPNKHLKKSLGHPIRNPHKFRTVGLLALYPELGRMLFCSQHHRASAEMAAGDPAGGTLPYFQVLWAQPGVPRSICPENTHNLLFGGSRDSFVVNHAIYHMFQCTLESPPRSWWSVNCVVGHWSDTNVLQRFSCLFAGHPIFFQYHILKWHMLNASSSFSLLGWRSDCKKFLLFPSIETEDQHMNKEHTKNRSSCGIFQQFAPTKSVKLCLCRKITVAIWCEGIQWKEHEMRSRTGTPTEMLLKKPAFCLVPVWDADKSYFQRQNVFSGAWKSSVWPSRSVI